MELADLVAEAEVRVERCRKSVAIAVAQLRAAEAELASLRTSSATGRIAPGTSRTEAIIEILKRAASPVQTSAIGAALNDNGLPSTGKDVSSTLHHLLTSGRVIRHGRGLYGAA